jgi:quercetin dioxygenase-like cupin family protein
MSLRIRRVVTGHDSQHKAIVTSDDILPVTTRRPGQEGCVVWALDRIPADNLDPADGAHKIYGTTLRNGVVFRVLRYDAGAAGRMHRTESMDCCVVLDGSIALELDDAVEVQLHAGDTLVQRGTVHRWINRGAEPCTIAFVLVDAAPLRDATHPETTP